jgi:hypothetical protein
MPKPERSNSQLAAVRAVGTYAWGMPGDAVAKSCFCRSDRAGFAVAPQQYYYPASKSGVFPVCPCRQPIERARPSST